MFDADAKPSVPASMPCDCTSGCHPALAAALGVGEPETRASLATSWKLWLAERDACPVGQAHRYSEQQIRYHYTEEKT